MKPKRLKKNDKVAIVCLSRGLLGMPFCKHELDIAIKRLKEYGLEPVIMPNAMLDMTDLEEHPEKRAEDLKKAFLDDSIKAIINAIGGDDTYKLIPYLMEDEEFKEAVKTHPKIFTGFSDTTNNHLLLNRLGLSTFYGPCLLVDIAELDHEMLPYTKQYFEKFFLEEKQFAIESSPIWYSDRLSYDVSEVGKPRIAHQEKHGFEVIQGSGIVRGKLYGGCIESLYNAYTKEEVAFLYQKYQLLPTIEEWKEKVLFLETSENKMEPAELEKILYEFKKRNILEAVQGILVGKPIDEVYYEEYKEVFQKVCSDINTPILYNVNFGHSVPRCIIPYDCKVVIDYTQKTILVDEAIFEIE